MSLLFDAAAPSYLPTDDLYITGITLSHALGSHRTAAKPGRNVG